MNYRYQASRSTADSGPAYIRTGRLQAESAEEAIEKVRPLLAMAGLYEVRLEENGVALVPRRVGVDTKRIEAVTGV